MPELLSTIGEGCESSLQNPGRKPSFRGLKTLESLNGFEPAIELFVVAFDEIRGFGTAIVVKALRFYIPSKKIAVVEDVLQCSDLQWIIVVSGCSPADMPLKVCLSEIWQIENLGLKILHERSVRFVAAYF